MVGTLWPAIRGFTPRQGASAKMYLTVFRSRESSTGSCARSDTISSSVSLGFLVDIMGTCR